MLGSLSGLTAWMSSTGTRGWGPDGHTSPAVPPGNRPLRLISRRRVAGKEDRVVSGIEDPVTKNASPRLDPYPGDLLQSALSPTWLRGIRSQQHIDRSP